MTLLDFNDGMPVGSQVGIATTDRGVISGLAIANPGAANSAQLFGALQTNPISQLKWYVDFANGNDTTGDGSQAKPLKTWQRAAQIWGLNAEWNGGVYEFCSLADVLVANGDFIYMPGFLRQNSTWLFHGSATAGQGQSVLDTSVARMTAATAQNRAGAGGGTPGTITDAAVPTGTWAGAGLISTNSAPNKRIRITDGAQAGTYAFPQRDEGAGKVDVSQWLAPTTFTGPILAAQVSRAEVALAGTEHFVVEKLTRIDLIIFDMVQSAGALGPNTGIFQICCESLDLRAYAVTKHATSFAGRTILFDGCCSLIPQGNVVQGWGGVFYQASHTKGGSCSGPQLIVCLATHQTASWAPGAGTFLTFDADCIAEGVPLCGLNAIGCKVTIGTAASFNSTSDGMTVNPDGWFLSVTSTYTANWLLWGSGAASSGINVLAGAQFLVADNTAPSILGAAGKDFSVGGVNIAHTWQKALGLYTAAIATTGADFGAAQPAALGA